MSDVVWQALIAALLAMYMEWSRRKAERAVRQVKNTLHTTTEQSNKKLEEMAEKVEEVHKATNSLTDRLVETTRIEAHAAGVKEQKDRE